MSVRNRYVVLGAGAVGCTLGGMLQASGADVVFVARGAQLGALQRDGLTLVLPSRSLHLAVTAVPDPAAVAFEPRDVLLLCTKSQHTEAALTALASAPRDLPIVCAQNGVRNEALAARAFARVYGMLVYAPLEFLVPGRVSVHTEPFAGGLDLGCSPHGVDALVDAVTSDLAGAGFDARVEPDILRLKHGKLLTNLANALQAVCGHAALAGHLLVRLRDEALACYRAAGIDFAPVAELEERYAEIREVPVAGARRSGGSTWQSLARGTGDIEVDALNGEIVRLGAAHGVRTPLNERIVALAHRAAAERWAPGSVPVSELSTSARG